MTAFAQRTSLHQLSKEPQNSHYRRGRSRFLFAENVFQFIRDLLQPSVQLFFP
jgi:hypothetical protein